MMTATGTGVRSFVWLVSLFPTSLLKRDGELPGVEIKTTGRYRTVLLRRLRLMGAFS